MINYSAYTRKGIRKEANDDRILVDDKLLSKASHSGKKKKALVSVVCDGVGSTSYAAEAAEMIAGSFIEFKADQSSPNILIRHLKRINEDIVEEQNQKKSGCSMASTVAGLIIYESSYLAFNLGDTRIYKMHSGELSLISYDHTVRNENLYYPGINRDALTRYMGGDGMACSPSFKRGIVEDNSMFLLCSDGIYKNIPEKDIKDVLASEITLSRKTKELYRLAVNGGSTDDTSIVLIDCSIRNRNFRVSRSA